MERVPLADVGYNGRVLKKIRLKNFKLHEDTSIEASRITVFIGPNNSGKSSIFQALLALKTARWTGRDVLVAPHQRQDTEAEQPFLYTQPDDPAVDLGDEYSGLLHDALQEMQIGADIELSAGPDATGIARAMGVLKLSFDVWFHENHLVRHKGWIECAYGRTTPWAWERGKAQQAEIVRLAIPQHGGELFVNPSEQLRSPFYCGVQFKQPPPDVDVPAMTNELNRLLDLWGRFLDSLRPVHQLRGFEEWAYPTTKFPGAENVERLVLCDRSVALTNLLAANAKLRIELSERLKSLVRVGMDFENAGLYRTKIFATSEKTSAPQGLFLNEGSGTNQLPFILVPIALAKPGETILMSEPEAHLHPKAQSLLTSMVLEISRKAELQFFIETHSEHVLHRLLNAVAKGELSKEGLALYYFENEDGRAKATPLAVNEHGQVDGGLPGFYDQSLDELTEYLDALRKH